MLHISAAALLLFETGFLQVVFSTASIQTHPGQSVTMWCSHNIQVYGYLYWFKQSDGAVPITIVYMLYTESRQKAEPNYCKNFTKDHLVMAMDQFSKITTLTIKKVNISDSGFYFCGATGYHMKFGNGTRLKVKAHAENHHNLNTIVNATMINDLPNYTGSPKNDHEKSSVSEECSRDIYFKLTLLFGGIIFFICIIPLILAIIREHRRQKHKKVAECQAQQHDDKENDSVEYTAVYFSNQRTKKSRTTY
uniref:Ig-like domain-containing protein n=1 Tax=Cyprinus carpio TaxID=7962 RepID=A0A8C1TY55_CYPCA